MTGARILILAGPNGAGKTTFAQQFLMQEAGCPRFINADLIAEDISPVQPEKAAIKAGRLMLQAIRDTVEKRQDFAFETTLAGITYAQKIPQWQHMGYRISLFFLKIERVETAIERVAVRVQQGGHNITEAVIRRRFESGWYNFQKHYAGLVDEWIVIDNNDVTPKVIKWSIKK